MIQKTIFILLLFVTQNLYGQTIELSHEECRRLIIHHKPQNNVEYTPGIDTSGNPVAPADLKGSNKFDIGKSVIIDLDLPLKKYAPRVKRGPGENPYTRDAIRGSSIHVGIIHVDEQGRTWINGQPVHDELLEKITRACQEKFPDL